MTFPLLGRKLREHTDPLAVTMRLQLSLKQNPT